jgi:hypothetical protein
MAWKTMASVRFYTRLRDFRAPVFQQMEAALAAAESSQTLGQDTDPTSSGRLEHILPLSPDPGVRFVGREKGVVPEEPEHARVARPAAGHAAFVGRDKAWTLARIERQLRRRHFPRCTIRDRPQLCPRRPALWHALQPRRHDSNSGRWHSTPTLQGTTLSVGGEIQHRLLLWVINNIPGFPLQDGKIGMYPLEDDSRLWPSLPVRNRDRCSFAAQPNRDSILVRPIQFDVLLHSSGFTDPPACWPQLGALGEKHLCESPSFSFVQMEWLM